MQYSIFNHDIFKTYTDGEHIRFIYTMSGSQYNIRSNQNPTPYEATILSTKRAYRGVGVSFVCCPIKPSRERVDRSNGFWVFFLWRRNNYC